MDTKRPYIIVVGIDYSELGQLALERAFEVASREPGGEPHVVHVATVLSRGLVGLDMPDDLYAVHPNEAKAQLESYVRHELDAWSARQPPENAAFERACTHQRLGSAGEEIAQLASDLDADLVIVGTHGRRGVSRLVLGSVAERAVRLAPCPVLVVRPKQVDLSVPQIEPPCPQCVETRKASGGAELWCEQHRVRHGERHTYHHVDRNVSYSRSLLVDPLPH